MPWHASGSYAAGPRFATHVRVVASPCATIDRRREGGQVSRAHQGGSGVSVNPDIDAVTVLIAQVSADLVLPRFRSLRAGDVSSKAGFGDTEDIVTVVDREVETALTDGLRSIVEAPVLGEEAAAADRSILDRVHADGYLWVVDPLDGTRNFASGSDGFGVMVSLVRDRQVRASWVYLPVRQEAFVAESGSGAFLNGQRIRVATAAHDPLRATLFVRFMPEARRTVVLARLDGRYVQAASCGAAAVEYTDVLRGRKDFVVYYRLLPWDHGAPAFVLTEAGGAATHLDGSAYAITSPSQVTVLTRDTALSTRVRGWIGDLA